MLHRHYVLDRSAKGVSYPLGLSALESYAPSGRLLPRVKAAQKNVKSSALIARRPYTRKRSASWTHRCKSVYPLELASEWIPSARRRPSEGHQGCKQQPPVSVLLCAPYAHLKQNSILLMASLAGSGSWILSTQEPLSARCARGMCGSSLPPCSHSSLRCKKENGRAFLGSLESLVMILLGIAALEKRVEKVRSRRTSLFAILCPSHQPKAAIPSAAADNWSSGACPKAIAPSALCPTCRPEQFLNLIDTHRPPLYPLLPLIYYVNLS